jgi:Trk K+ transport system NAD-binding subunit
MSSKDMSHEDMLHEEASHDSGSAESFSDMTDSTQDQAEPAVPQEDKSKDKSQRTALVIGLGLYGSTLAIELTSLGWHVLAVDTDPKITEKLVAKVSGVRVIDANDRNAIESLDPRRFDVCICAMGEESVQALTFTIFNLKEAKAKFIISRSVNEMHDDLFKELGADLIVNPERDFASSLGKVLDQLEFSTTQDLEQTKRDQYSALLPKQVTDSILSPRVSEPRSKDQEEREQPHDFFKIIASRFVYLMIMFVMLYVIVTQHLLLRSLNAPFEWYQSKEFLSVMIILILVWLIGKIVTHQSQLTQDMTKR